MPPPKLISTDRAFALLRELEHHPACARALLTYTPLTAADLAAMTEEGRASRSAEASTAVHTTRNWQQARDVVRTLGRVRFAPAVDLLARVWRHALIVPLRTAAGHALFEIGSPAAHAALQAALVNADPFGHPPTFLAIKSLVAAATNAAFDHLEPFFHEGSDAPLIAGQALRFFSPATEGRDGRTWRLPLVPELLRADRRWIRAAVRLRHDARIGSDARALLSSLPNEEIDTALAETPDLPSPPPPAYSGPRDLLARYERGEIEADADDHRHLQNGSPLDRGPPQI